MAKRRTPAASRATVGAATTQRIFRQLDLGTTLFEVSRPILSGGHLRTTEERATCLNSALKDERAIDDAIGQLAERLAQQALVEEARRVLLSLIHISEPTRPY